VRFKSQLNGVYFEKSLQILGNKKGSLSRLFYRADFD